ncbi:MAG TPA: hypothetical protein VKJ45_15190, partial [Blastocatellia bacterium]|nr:hypothetical protein [Blastocatellia bacterium]
MKSLAKLAVSYPWAVIAITLGITLAMGSVIAIRGIHFNGSLESLARKDSDSQFYDKVKGAFGDDRVIVVALTTDDVFTPQFVNKLAKLTSELEAVPGVEEAQSITNIKSIRRAGDDVVVDKLVPPGASEEELKALRAGV